MCGSRWGNTAYRIMSLLGGLLVSIASMATDDRADLGRLLFFDTNLSARRTQSCATCHDPERAFSDGRDNGVGGAASRGDDGVSLGDRNAPSISYAALVPPFEINAGGEHIGGLFYDGRAADLAAQAAEPVVNAREMALPDRATAVARLREQEHYRTLFSRLFGDGVLNNTDRAYSAMTSAIAAFERSPPFLAFDSRYDRYLRGEVVLTAQEDLGRRLFFSDLVNCMSCHLLPEKSVMQREAFTDHRYHNIGIPASTVQNQLGNNVHRNNDVGLAANPAAPGIASIGRFRTPSLRNVAVTAPYMHNGVFARLETAIHFYNRYLVDNTEATTNPETGAPWGDPEIAENLALNQLRRGQPLNAQRVAVLVAFLRTLTVDLRRKLTRDLH